jgi:hypothetical protein
VTLSRSLERLCPITWLLFAGIASGLANERAVLELKRLTRLPGNQYSRLPCRTHAEAKRPRNGFAKRESGKNGSENLFDVEQQRRLRRQDLRQAEHHQQRPDDPPPLTIAASNQGKFPTTERSFLRTEPARG